jgi:hypothetical protein
MSWPYLCLLIYLGIGGALAVAVAVAAALHATIAPIPGLLRLVLLWPLIGVAVAAEGARQARQAARRRMVAKRRGERLR